MEEKQKQKQNDCLVLTMMTTQFLYLKITVLTNHLSLQFHMSVMYKFKFIFPLSKQLIHYWYVVNNCYFDSIRLNQVKEVTFILKPFLYLLYEVK